MKKSTIDYKEFGFFRVAAAAPKLRVADPVYNASEMKNLLVKASEEGVSLMVFPELSVTGYTCQDLFFQKTLQDSALRSFDNLLTETSDLPVVFAAGLPVVVNSRMYNCAVIACRGEVLGIIPKTFIPNSREFYEKRWFSAFEHDDATEIDFLGRSVPFGRVLIELEGTGIILGTEICEDLWAVTPPSSDMVLEGANVIINLSASNELVAKSAYRAGLVVQQSARGICAYVYASAGVHESTTDMAFSGDAIIAENGALLSRGKRFLRDSTYISADIDIPRLEFDRLNSSSFGDSHRLGRRNFGYATVPYSGGINIPDVTVSLRRPVLPFPFVPRSKSQRAANCEEIFNIQVAGLAKRLEHTGIGKVYIGISGGLDSTLALLVCHMTFTLLGLPLTGINGVTMPGFGTTGRTYNNALTLMRELGISIEEIDIRESCTLHFRDIGHNPEVLDVTYENVQARERTQILMDLANKHAGLVIGTGDLSEQALGWCTYNGDHMSMYAVNSSIPKTLVRYLVEWIMQTRESEAVCKVLKDVLDTPISPELLPPDAEGLISQKTEDLIGPYELHDFFLYYFLRQGTVPKKLLFLAEKAFEGKYSHDTIARWLKVFYRRFFSQQFKRSCVPDGPKVGTVALSPRGDWRMSSDSQVDVWLDF